MEDVNGRGGGALEGLRDDGRVDTLAEKPVRGAEQAPADDDNGGCSVTGLDVLGGREVHQHLRRGMHDGHALQHGIAVVCDYRLTLAALDHLVHAPGAERGPDGIGDSCEGIGVSLGCRAGAGRAQIPLAATMFDDRTATGFSLSYGAGLAGVWMPMVGSELLTLKVALELFPLGGAAAAMVAVCWAKGTG